ncbi:MAG: SDR family NAD(P)-dependent oxidoreductase, partial [Oscillospiraceae bacterium]|nr:SDR family NAD(P)-dependent oxidoreductase [Oscillospiraceae bacterium]
IDTLVNCAGFGISGAAEFTALDDAKRLMEVNFFGSFICDKAAIPYLRETKGSIVHISSVGGPLAIPFQAFYSCSKMAINALTLALANELRPFGIRVCAVMPGDVKTGFTAAREKSAAGEALYGDRVQKSVAVMERDEQNGMPPVSIAKKIYKMSREKRPKPLCTVGLQYKFFLLLYRVMPWRLVNWIVGRIYD